MAKHRVSQFRFEPRAFGRHETARIREFPKTENRGESMLQAEIGKLFHMEDHQRIRQGNKRLLTVSGHFQKG